MTEIVMFFLCLVAYRAICVAFDWQPFPVVNVTVNSNWQPLPPPPAE